MNADSYRYIFNFTNNALKEKNKPNLIIWPETALHIWALDTPLKERILKIAKDNNTFILAGLPVMDEEIQYNSAVLFTPEGKITRYDKKVLVPIMESSFAPGTRSGIFKTSIGNIAIVKKIN